MRVLQFRKQCDSGGVSSSMLLLGRELERRGIACEYWFCRPSNRLDEFMATGKATLGPLSGLAPRLRRGDFDVVHMTASDPLAEVVAAMAGRARVVVTARGALSDNWHRANCFAYTAISRGMAEVNQPYTDVAIDVVRNSLDVSRFAPPVAGEVAGAGAPIVAFVGRTTAPEKDFPRFTRIARRLAERGARVWVADPHEGRWEKFAGLPVERVEVERWERVPHAEIPAFYRSVAASGGVVLITSKTEGFGNAAPEAASCGARVAAPDVMGLREAVIDGVTGMLFPADASDDEAARRIADYMAGPHDMAACAEAARTAFSPDAMTDAYLAIYGRSAQQVVAARPQPVTTREMPLLLRHLAQQREWRSSSSLWAAADLANAGDVTLSRRALRLALGTSLKPLLTRSGARNLVKATARLARRTVGA